MKQISVVEFRKAIIDDPSWASKLTEPVEISEYCSLTNSPISDLSPLLHFTGKDKGGKCAWFHNCKALKVAEGHFAGSVGFEYSGIQKIGDLHIAEACETNEAADFTACSDLEVAEGTYPGYVSFNLCGITKVGELKILAAAKISGFYAGLGGTPFATESPIEAAEIMTGSRLPKQWRECRNRIPSDVPSAEVLDEAIRLEKERRKAREALRGPDLNPQL